jgi:hypothetical protein
VVLAQSNPVPFINQPLVPASAVPGAHGFTLTVNGTEFVSGSVVHWNGTALATTFVSSSQLTATVPAAEIIAPGTAAVTVANAAPGGGVSNVMYFVVANQASSLVFSGLYSGSNGAGFTTIAADFNGDGKLDLAFVSISPTGLLIELGNGDATFQSPHLYSLGSDTQGIFAADFNGDGKLDIAVANGYDNTVSVLLGNGDGTLQAAKTFATGYYPFSVASGDFNGDGKLDLVVACNGGGNNNGSISILLGNGDGTFRKHTDYTPPGTGFITVNAMTVGDFNSDGKLDIALVDNEVNELFILVGNGTGTFRFTNGVPTVSYGIRMLAPDVNGDGKLDLVIAEATTPGQIAVLIGNGDGTFQPAVQYSPGGSPQEVEAGDFNADGKIDLAAPNTGSSTVGILLGNGDGTFQSALTFPTEGNPFGLAVGDFNGDGQTDLAVTLSNAPNELLVLRQGPGPALTTTTLASSQDPSAYGQALTFTALVTSGLGAPPDGEIVTFMKGTKVLGTGSLSGGSASFATSALPVGTNYIKAVYSGDSNFRGSTSKAVKQVVNRASTTTTLTSSQNPSKLGQSVTFTASMTAQFSGTVKGSVTFYDGTTALKTVYLSGGVAKFTTSMLTSGAHSITATYNGNANFIGSSASLTQTVN